MKNMLDGIQFALGDLEASRTPSNNLTQVDKSRQEVNLT